MPTWIWTAIVVVGVLAVGALVWWTSGRSPLRKGGVGLTADQRLQVDQHRLDATLRSNLGLGPNNPGGR